MIQWFQAALWGTNIVFVFFAYRPPKRHTALDNLSLWQKIAHLDLVGCSLLLIGLTLFLTGATFGSDQYSWTDPRTLSTLIIGNIGLIAFGLYEWKGTSTGLVHHDLFHGGKGTARTFILCVFLIFIEGLCIFAFALFYPIMYVSHGRNLRAKEIMKMCPGLRFSLQGIPFWSFFDLRRDGSPILFPPSSGGMPVPISEPYESRCLSALLS